MSRTRRSLSYELFRRPHGHRQAVAAGARSVPPSDYDDIAIAGWAEAAKPVIRYLQTSIGRSWDAVRSHILRRHGPRMAAWADLQIVRHGEEVRILLTPMSMKLTIDDRGILRPPHIRR